MTCRSTTTKQKVAASLGLSFENLMMPLEQAFVVFKQGTHVGLLLANVVYCRGVKVEEGRGWRVESEGEGWRLRGWKRVEC